MKRILLLSCAFVLAALSTLAPAQSQKPVQSHKPAPRPVHTFAVEGDHFTLDGKPFKVLSGELHYARIPREYWHARLKMARAMGLNTIATYVFWDLHEPRPGVYDFSSQNDLAAFIRAAQEEGLYVILRAGPYICGEWDLGGLPPWLLADPNSAAALRSDSPAFLSPVSSWIKRLNQEVGGLQIGKGGPIIVTQVENEYGGFGSDHVYMQHMVDLFRAAGFNDSLLDTVDGFNDLAKGAVPGIFAGVNFGIGNHQKGMDAAAAFRPDQPIFVTEYWPGWFDSWGHPHQTRPTPPQLEDVDYILAHGAGLNLYMFHGGTSFGFMSGADMSRGNYLPDTTSYDYGAPLDESGRPTPKFFELRKIFAKYSPCGDESCLPPVPASAPIITIPPVALNESTPLWANLPPKPIRSANPLTMEAIGQSYGYILYRAHLPAAVAGDLVLTELHDYAQVYLDGKLAGTLDRRLKQSALAITTTAPAVLDIFVEAAAHINYSKAMRTDQKGITQSVTLAGIPVTGWEIYSLPMTTSPIATSRELQPTTEEIKDSLYANLPLTASSVGKVSLDHCGFAYGSVCGAPSVSVSLPPSIPEKDSLPTFFRANFNLTATGDTFLDVRALGKGMVWINGHALGRFWNVGPQDTLYVPGPWLKVGANEIVIFDLKPPFKFLPPFGLIPQVSGLDHPILDAPVADQSGNRKQE
jgi:beta-galactosidase